MHVTKHWSVWSIYISDRYVHQRSVGFKKGVAKYSSVSHPRKNSTLLCIHMYWKPSTIHLFGSIIYITRDLYLVLWRDCLWVPNSRYTGQKLRKEKNYNNLSTQTHIHIHIHTYIHTLHICSCDIYVMCNRVILLIITTLARCWKKLGAILRDDTVNLNRDGMSETLDIMSWQWVFTK